MLFYQNFSVFFLAVYLLKDVTVTAVTDETNEFVVALDLYAVCGNKIRCSRDLFMECDHHNPHFRCQCHDRQAIQVNFLKFSVFRLCLIRAKRTCEPDGENNTKVIYNHAKFLDEIKAIRDAIRDPESNLTKKYNEKIKSLKSAYGERAVNAKPWESWAEDKMDNYTQEVNDYYRARKNEDMYCASGECGSDGKCTLGVYPGHSITGKEREYKSSAQSHTQYFLLNYLIIIVILKIFS